MLYYELIKTKHLQKQQLVSIFKSTLPSFLLQANGIYNYPNKKQIRNVFTRLTWIYFWLSIFFDLLREYMHL